MKTPSTAGLLQAAKTIALAGGRHTLKFFRKPIAVESKADASPVTRADKEAEWLMRKMILKKFPGHGVIGEEHGRVNPESPVQWVLDPIDGTKSFIHGIPLYTTLLGILVNNKPVIGIVYAPAMDEFCDAAMGRGTRLNGKRCRVRRCATLNEATFLTTDPAHIYQHGFGKAYDALRSKTEIHRTWGDAYGHMMVATGRADIMFDPVLNLWDAAALITVVREAGGSYTDVKGRASIESGNGLSCGSKLLPKILALFSK